jgi:hypothetical protein
VRFRFIEMELGWIPDFLKKTHAGSSETHHSGEPVLRLSQAPSGDMEVLAHARPMQLVEVLQVGVGVVPARQLDIQVLIVLALYMNQRGQLVYITKESW